MYVFGQLKATANFRQLKTVAAKANKIRQMEKNWRQARAGYRHVARVDTVAKHYVHAVVDAHTYTSICR